MKIVATADWHIHEFQEFSKSIPVIWDSHKMRFVESSTGRLMNSRLMNTLEGICDIRDYCISNKIKYVLNAGDVFHKRGTISVNAFNAAYKVISSFREAGIELIIIAGNHDQVDASDNPATSIYTFSNIATIIESPTILSISDGALRAPEDIGRATPALTDKGGSAAQVQILALPYSKNKNYLLSEFHRLMPQVENTKKSILMLHLGIQGGVVGSGMTMVNEDYQLSEFSPEKWRYIILGHFHRPQLLAANAFYTGTPVQNSFSDELPIEFYGGYNGFFLMDLDLSKDNLLNADSTSTPLNTDKPLNADSVSTPLTTDNSTDLSKYNPTDTPTDSVSTLLNPLTTDTPIKPRDRLDFIPITRPRFRTVTNPSEITDKDYFRIQSSEETSISESNVRVEVQKDYSQPVRSKITLGDSFEAGVAKYVEENCTLDNKDKVLKLGLDILMEAKEVMLE